MKVFNRKIRILERVYNDGTAHYVCQKEGIFGGWNDMKIKIIDFCCASKAEFYTLKEARAYLYGNDVIRETVIRDE